MKVKWWGGDPQFGTPNDTLTIYRLSIHFCGPWDHGAPLRLHVNWFKRGYRCSYCGADWLALGGCAQACEPGHQVFGADGEPYRPRPVWGRDGWHFAIGLRPGHGFAKPSHEGPGSRQWYFSTPKRKARQKAAYARWKEEHDQA